MKEQDTREGDQEEDLPTIESVSSEAGSDTDTCNPRQCIPDCNVDPSCSPYGCNPDVTCGVR